MRSLKIGGAALNQTPLDWNNNFKNIAEAIKIARADHVDILCLPELSITGYGCEDLFLSEWLPQKAYVQLEKIAQLTEGIAVTLTIPVKFGGALYNCACLISDKKILGFNPKQNLANEGVHYEPRWFKPGIANQNDIIKILDHGYPFGEILYDIKGIKVGFETCEDAWSTTTRPLCSLQKKGVELVLNSSASHFALGKANFRKELITKASKDFHCAYIMVNMLGNESGRLIFDGQILFCQNGILLQSSPTLSYKDLIYTSQIFHFDNNTESPKGYIDEKNKNEEFTAAVSLGLFDYLRKSKSQGFVLSLSGGADSSSCAVLVAESVRRGIHELGTESFIYKTGVKKLQELANKQPDEKTIVHHLLTCAYQGSANSSEATYNSARQLAESIGAVFYHWNIDSDVKSYTHKVETAIGRTLTWNEDDITLQNIQARARAPIIWMLANLQNSLLITTSNRSEGDVGYATMDGDTSGSLAPIAAIDKYFLLNWLKWAETELGYSGLKKVNALNPTAELRPPEKNQSDEDDLMPYVIITEIERLAIGKRLSPKQIFEELKLRNLENAELLKQHIIKFFRLWSRNQWKRERIAPSFHLDDFNVDPRGWCRFPILSGGYEDEISELELAETN